MYNVHMNETIVKIWRQGSLEELLSENERDQKGA